MNNNPSNQFRSKTPDLDQAEECNIDAIGKMMDKSKILKHLNMYDAERDIIRNRRYKDTLREMQIDKLEDALRQRLEELNASTIEDVKAANQHITNGRQSVKQFFFIGPAIINQE